MSTYVYVGNLDRGTTEESLRAAFAAKGHPVKSTRVMRSPQNDRSRRFGFIEVETEAEAAAVIEAMNGMEVDGSALRLGQVKERPRPRESRSHDHFGSGPRRTGGARRKTR